MNKGFSLIEIFFLIFGLFKALEVTLILFTFSELNFFLIIVIFVILVVTLPLAFLYLWIMTYSNKREIFNIFFVVINFVIYISIYFIFPYFIFINYFLLILNFSIGIVSIALTTLASIPIRKNK